MDKCAHRDCSNLVDPRWYAYCLHGKVHNTCDGHSPEGSAPHEHSWNSYVLACPCSGAAICTPVPMVVDGLTCTVLQLVS